MKLKECNNKLCERLVHVGTDFCCYPCRLADDGGYEIHENGSLAHSPMCDIRREARRGLKVGDHDRGTNYA